MAEAANRPLLTRDPEEGEVLACINGVHQAFVRHKLWGSSRVRS